MKAVTYSQMRIRSSLESKGHRGHSGIDVQPRGDLSTILPTILPPFQQLPADEEADEDQENSSANDNESN